MKYSIGSNSSLGSNTPSSTSGSDPFVIGFSDSVNANVSVGDIFTISDDTTYYGTFIYVLTAISGSSYTLKYISDDGGNGATSPYGLMEYSGMGPSQSSGSWTRAFSSIIVFEEMVDNSTPALFKLTNENVTGLLYSDATFTDTNVNFNNVQSLGSVTLTVPEAHRHSGVAASAGTSAVLYKPAAAGGKHDLGAIQLSFTNAKTPFRAEWLEINMANTSTLNKCFTINTNNSGNPIQINNNLLHSKSGNPGNTGPYGIWDGRSNLNANRDTVAYYCNNIIYDFVETNNDSTQGILAVNAQGRRSINNNTIYNIKAQGSSKVAIGINYNNDSNGYAVFEIRNNICAKCWGSHTSNDNYRPFWDRKDDAGAGQSGIVNASNNLSDDFIQDTIGTTKGGHYQAPGPNSLVNQSIGDIAFVSVVGGAYNLKITDSSSAAEAGYDLGTTSGVNIDIGGFDRDGVDVSWDIGAYQVTQTPDSVGGGGFALFIDD